MTDRARHPSGSSVGLTEACALAAWPPQKNVGTAPYPKEFTEPWLPACRCQSPDGLRCGRSAVAAAGDGDPASNSDQLVAIPVPYRGSPVAVVSQAKQRVTSNGLPSFRMW